MNFRLYWERLPDKAAKDELAKRVGTIPVYLHHIATGFRTPSALMARKISDATDGQVTPADLRPDVFGGMV